MDAARQETMLAQAKLDEVIKSSGAALRAAKEVEPLKAEAALARRELKAAGEEAARLKAALASAQREVAQGREGLQAALEKEMARAVGAEGRASKASRVRGTWPPCCSTKMRQVSSRLRALVRYRPIVLM